MPLVVASGALSDADFLRAFDTCELPLSSFKHGDHLRLAWLHLERANLPAAIESVREGIRRFADAHGVSHIFHVTITEAWMHLLASHPPEPFADFIAANEHRLTRARLEAHFSPELLQSDRARAAWVEPDRARLPRPVR